MGRNVDMIANAIEKGLIGVGVDILDGGCHLVVSAKDHSCEYANVRLRHDEDIDEIVFWLTESIERSRKGLEPLTLSETITKAVASEKAGDNGDRPMFEPRSLDGLPPPIADDIRRRIIYRLMIQGYRGPRLRLAIAETLKDHIPSDVVDGDVRAIAAEIIRTSEMEKGVEAHLLSQELAKRCETLWADGDRKNYVKLVRDRVKLATMRGPVNPRGDYDPLKEWSVEEMEHYIATDEAPKGKPIPRVH